jgi:hypothetical protein
MHPRRQLLQELEFEKIKKVHGNIPKSP